MATEIAPGVLQIDTLLGGWERVTAGFLIAGDEPVLVETGSQSSVDVLRAELDATEEQRREADRRRSEAEHERGIAATERARAEAMLEQSRELLYAHQVRRAASVATTAPRKAAAQLPDARARAGLVGADLEPRGRLAHLGRQPQHERHVVGLGARGRARRRERDREGDVRRTRLPLHHRSISARRISSVSALM